MRLIIPLLAIIIGIGVFMFTSDLPMFQEPEQKVETKIVEVPKVVVQEVPTVDILVARAPIKIGTELKDYHFDRQPWPQHLVLQNFIVSDGQDSDVIGLVTRAAFQAREPIIRTKLANKNDPSFLAASLEPGERAVTISVDALSSVAGFIFPGDRVDVLINHKVDMGRLRPGDENSPRRREEIMEVLLSDVKVIATDQNAEIVEGQGVRPPASATIAVSKADAQKLKLAEANGKLSLALRPMDDGSDVEVARPTGLNDLSRITPPSYFPVLYESTGDYAAALIDPFGSSVNEDSSAVISAELQAEIQKNLSNQSLSMDSMAMPTFATRDQDDASGTNAGAPGMDFGEESSKETKITVVRGTDVEEIGVTRP